MDMRYTEKGSETMASSSEGKRLCGPALFVALTLISILVKRSK